MTGSRQIVFSSARRAPRRRWTRAGGILLAVAAVVVVIALLLAGSLWTYAWARLGGDSIAGIGGDVTALGNGELASPAGATTALVVLTAPRDPTDPAAPELRGPVLLVQAGGPREVPAVLALPVELPVTADGLPTMSIAELQLEGDLDATVSAVADYTRVRIDHVVSASEDLLPRLVEVRGAEACDGDVCRSIPAVEARRAQAEGTPEERVQATATVLGALAGELHGVRALTSPLASKRTIDVVAGELRTDVSLRGTGLLDVARQLEDAPALDVAVVPMLRNPETGRSVLLEQAETLFQRFREGAPLEDAGDDAAPSDLTTAELVGSVDVAILNAAGIDGLAGRLEARLAADGFRIRGTGNAPSFSDGGTVITYDPGDPAAEVAAILLAEQLEGATLREAERPLTFEGDPIGVEVLAGSDLDEAS